jgi:hypothetical protein
MKFFRRKWKRGPEFRYLVGACAALGAAGVLSADDKKLKVKVP